MKYSKALFSIAAGLLVLPSLAVEVPSGRLVTSTIDSCDSSICEPCYYVEPSFDHACSDDFDKVDYTDFRTSLGLPDFNEECIRHDSCYQVLGNTKAQCEIDFEEKLYESCEGTYIGAIPVEVRNLINNSDAIRREAELLILEAYNSQLSDVTGISGAEPITRKISLGSILNPDPTNPLDDTPLDSVNDSIGDGVDDITDEIIDITTNPFDGTLLDDEKFDQLGNELANLEDSVRDLIGDINLAKYYMCTASADLMVSAVATGPGTLTGFDMYQRDAISLTTKQQNVHTCPIDDLQIVETENRNTAKNVINGIFRSHNLNLSAENSELYTGVWDVYGKQAFGQAAEDADRMYKAVILVPVLSTLLN